MSLMIHAEIGAFSIFYMLAAGKEECGVQDKETSFVFKNRRWFRNEKGQCQKFGTRGNVNRFCAYSRLFFDNGYI